MKPQLCPRCEKTENLCLCADVKPMPTKLSVFILQHPQEPDKDLGSARLATLALEGAQLRVGLSVPNLKKALGREEVNPSKWAVLYLGSGVKAHNGWVPQGMVTFVTKAGAPLHITDDRKARAELEGIIVLDGTWSQAKALWWRNAWLLKCRRIVLTPKEKSLYRELRKEPRRECLSTIESVALVLDAFGEDPAVGNHLRGTFSALLGKVRANKKAGKPAQKKTAAVDESTTAASK